MGLLSFGRLNFFSSIFHTSLMEFTHYVFGFFYLLKIRRSLHFLFHFLQMGIMKASHFLCILCIFQFLGCEIVSLTRILMDFSHYRCWKFYFVWERRVVLCMIHLIQCWICSVWICFGLECIRSYISLSLLSSMLSWNQILQLKSEPNPEPFGWIPAGSGTDSIVANGSRSRNCMDLFRTRPVCIPSQGSVSFAIMQEKHQEMDKEEEIWLMHD